MEFTKNELQAQNCNLRAELEFLEQRVEELEDELAGKEWVSVKDRLPEKGTEFLACLDCGRVYLLSRSRYQNCYYRNARPFYLDEAGVTHWMPLPSPPEVKK